MKAPLVLVAVLGILAFAGPAHAAVWDFGWLSTAMFGPGRDGSPPVDTRVTGATTATITRDATSNHLTIDFATPFGPGSVFVNQDHSALGGVPMVFCRDCPPSVGPGTSIGQYSFTGPFENPDRFTLAMSSG